MSDRTRTKLRRCLQCTKYFTSVWAGNRICPSCKKLTYRSGDMLPTELESVLNNDVVKVVYDAMKELTDNYPKPCEAGASHASDSNIEE